MTYKKDMEIHPKKREKDVPGCLPWLHHSFVSFTIFFEACRAEVCFQCNSIIHTLFSQFFLADIRLLERENLGRVIGAVAPSRPSWLWYKDGFNQNYYQFFFFFLNFILWLLIKLQFIYKNTRYIAILLDAQCKCKHFMEIL